jgi:hypothetical protein
MDGVGASRVGSEPSWEGAELGRGRAGKGPS